MKRIKKEKMIIPAGARIFFQGILDYSNAHFSPNPHLDGGDAQEYGRYWWKDENKIAVLSLGEDEDEFVLVSF